MQLTCKHHSLWDTWTQALGYHNSDQITKMTTKWLGGRVLWTEGWFTSRMTWIWVWDCADGVRAHHITQNNLNLNELFISGSESRSVVSHSLWPHGLYSPWNTPGWNMGVPSPGDLPNPGMEPRSPTLQAGSLPAEPQRKPLFLEFSI